jgi:hypothetical protein
LDIHIVGIHAKKGNLKLCGFYCKNLKISLRAQQTLHMTNIKTLALATLGDTL